MTSIMIPTRAWAALSWVALATDRDPRSPILGMVKFDYTPGAEGVAPPRLTAHATDRHRIHRVIVDLPAADNADEPEAWSSIIPAPVIVEASKHASVGKARITLIPLTITVGRIEAGYEGWGAAIPVEPGNWPPVERLLPEAPADTQTGPVTLRMQYLADLAKYNLGGRRDIDDQVWTLTWTGSTSSKPGPVFAYREDDLIAAAALIQPNLKLR